MNFNAKTFAHSLSLIALLFGCMIHPGLLAGGSNEGAASTNARLVGIVLPADAHPGERVSGSLVQDPKRYEGVPGLKVVTVSQALPGAGAGGSASLTGLVLNTGKKEPQTGDGPIQFTIPDNTSYIRMTLSSSQDRAVCSRIAVPMDRTPRPEPEHFDCPGVVNAGGIQVIHGPFDGDSDETRVDFGGHPADVIAESPRGAYVQIPPDLAPGPQDLTVSDGPHTVKLQVFVLGLGMSADQLMLMTGQSTKYHIVVSGLENLPESAWQSAIPNDLVDSAKLLQISPGFKMPKPGEKGVVLLRIENMTPDVISMTDSKNEAITFTLDRKNFAKGPFHYDGSVKSKRAGTFNINGTVIAFLAPVSGEERDVTPDPDEIGADDLNDQELNQQASERLRELSEKTRDSYSHITDPVEKEQLERLSKYLEDRAKDLQDGIEPISDDVQDLLFDCQTDDDPQATKRRMQAYFKYLDSMDPKLKADLDQLQKEREELKKKEEEARRKAEKANIQKFDPDKKKKSDDAYKDYEKAWDKVKKAHQNFDDAKQKAEDAAKDQKNAKGNEFKDYDQAKKDLAAANEERDKAKQAWDKAYDDNQKSINPDLKKEEDKASGDAKKAADDFKQKSDEYMNKLEEYKNSGDKKLLEEYEKLREEYLHPPNVKT